MYGHQRRSLTLNLAVSNTQRTIIGIAGTVLVVAAVTVLCFRHLLVKSLPDAEGSMKVAGITGPVEIYRDNLGVPHVIASNDMDMYFAAGFVHAQDRLWQMDMLRRYAQGRLAEVLGPPAVASDKAMRILGLAALADSLAAGASPQSRAMLDAYARGVNAWIRAARGALPVEFDILQYAPEPWTPAHSILLWRALAWDLSHSWSMKLLASDLLHKAGPTKVAELLAIRRDIGGEIATILASYVPECAVEFERNLASPWSRLGEGRIPAGGNSWLVGAGRTLTGAALLAGDIDCAHTIPSPLYLLHMAAPGVNAAGFSIPGIPAIVTGSNTAFAWSMAVPPSDNTDLYLEHISYRDSTYEFRGARLPLAVGTDSIIVRDAAPVVVSTFATRHGPIINPPFSKPDAARWIAAQSSISIAWTGFHPGDEMLAFDRMHRARSIADAAIAVKSITAPVVAFLVAGRDGSGGMVRAGTAPDRQGMSGLLPVPGWDGRHEWAGLSMEDASPLTLSSERPVIIQAGNSPEGAPAGMIRDLYASTRRSTYLADLLSSQTVFKLRDVQLMQLDIRSPGSAPMRDAMVVALDGMPNRPQELTDLRALLAGWDLSNSAFQPASAVYNIAMLHLARETFEDEMGPALFRRFMRTPDIVDNTITRMLADTTTTWFDNITTPGIETRDNIIRKALVMTVRDLQRRFGNDMRAWKWGELHTIRFTHPLGSEAALGASASPGPHPLGGNSGTLNAAPWRYDHPYEVTAGPVARFAIDMASPDECTVILSTGESGQPFSAHYSDMTAMWLNGIPHRLFINPAAAKTQRWRVFTLMPE